MIEQPERPGVHNPADLPPAPAYRGPATEPAAGGDVNALVLNVIVPGLGSLVRGRWSGAVMLLLCAVGIAMFFVMPGWTRLVGIVPILGSWLWSLAAGMAHLGPRSRETD